MGLRLGLAIGALAVILIQFIPMAYAQQQVLPGYQICSAASGITKCSFQPVGSDTVLGVKGLPMGAMAVTSCGAESYTNGVPYVLEQDLTGKLCTNATGGGGGGAVTIADGADVTQGAIADAASVAGGVGTLSAKLRLMTTQLGTINTTLGSPFQAGGSIANTSFAATQGTAANLNATVVGTGTFAVQNTTAAGENHIGEVGGNILPITNAMTTSNATVTTGQSIGGIQTLANAVRVSGALGASGTSGIIQSVVLTFLDAVGSGPLDIYFYNATVTTGSNCQNATTFVLQTADRTNVLGIAHVTDPTASNTAVVFQANNLAIPFGLASGTSLFACVVARASFAITGTANASIKVNVLRN